MSRGEPRQSEERARGAKEPKGPKGARGARGREGLSEFIYLRVGKEIFLEPFFLESQL